MKVVRSIRFNPGEARTFNPAPEDIARQEQGNLYITSERLLFISREIMVSIGHRD